MTDVQRIHDLDFEVHRVKDTFGELEEVRVYNVQLRPDGTVDIRIEVTLMAPEGKEDVDVRGKTEGSINVNVEQLPDTVRSDLGERIEELADDITNGD